MKTNSVRSDGGEQAGVSRPSLQNEASNSGSKAELVESVSARIDTCHMLAEPLGKCIIKSTDV